MNKGLKVINQASKLSNYSLSYCPSMNINTSSEGPGRKGENPGEIRRI